MNALHPLAGTPPVSCDHACHRRRKPPSGGTDYKVPVGTPVRAPVDGTVIWMTNAAAGWGIRLRMRDGGGDIVLAHLSSRPVPNGTKVRQGAEIALSGGAKGHPGAGSSTGPHLHAEVQRGNGREGMDEWLAEMNGPEWAGGGTTPIEGDDMQADEREALFQIRDVLGAKGGLNTETAQSVAYLVRDLSAALTKWLPEETRRSDATAAGVDRLEQYVIDGGPDVDATLGATGAIFGLLLALSRRPSGPGGDMSAVLEAIDAVPAETLKAFGLARIES